MKPDISHGYGTIERYVEHKLSEYGKCEKSFDVLFEFMFDQADSTMIETSEGFRIKKTTYGRFKRRIIRTAPTVARALEGAAPDSMIGLYMSNCPEWILFFWAILMCGYRPLLMNTRLPDEVLEGVLADHKVDAVISDSKTFSVKTLLKDDLLEETDGKLSPRSFGSEVIFMSSGTTEKVKLCAYTGENFYYQICDSANIIKQCPDIKNSCDGEIKQIVLLPLCHVFGFIAVYMWFAFFSCVFVFPKQLDAVTVQSTVKRHKVTHVFAVPMVWEAVYKAANRTIKSRGEKTYRKFVKVSGIVNRTGRLGDLIAKCLFKEVREGLFGDSIRFLISGGSGIRTEILEFFNGIGYHMANGYGMTEIGITSVEKASSKRILNSGSIGAPFGNTFYSVSDSGILLVRGRTMASRIMQGNSVQITDFDKWFSTNDIVQTDGERYFIKGRADDLIVGDDGENLNPVIAEEQFRADGIDRLCILKDSDARTLLLVGVTDCFTAQKLKNVYEEVCKTVRESKLESVISKILFTRDPLLEGNDFKINRTKIARRFAEGRIKTFDPRNIGEHVTELAQELEGEVTDCFRQALSDDGRSIAPDDNFFRDLGGSSLDYFSLASIIKNRYGVDLLTSEGERLASVRAICERITNKEKQG